MVVPIGFVSQTEIDGAVTRAAGSLGTEVVRLRHSLGADTSGEPAIFFRVVLADWAVDEKTLADVSGSIADKLVDQLHPYENWGTLSLLQFPR